MWWMPPSVAKAALCGPTSTLLTVAHLRNSLGKETVSSTCVHREELAAKTAVAASSRKFVFIPHLHTEGSVGQPMSACPIGSSTRPSQPNHHDSTLRVYR